MEPLSPILCRRGMLTAGLSTLTWLTPLGQLLARAEEQRRGPARSVIVLWLDGGPSQLDTFDPKPGSAIAGNLPAISTAVPGVQFAAGYEQLAEQMPHLALVRSLVSAEGDHERGVYTLKSGHRPDPTVVHPSLGAVICHALPNDGVDIPRHISILPSEHPSRGGMLGNEYDAFRMADPAEPVPDTMARSTSVHQQQLLEDLNVVEAAFRKNRGARGAQTGHLEATARARQLMSSEQLRAFEVRREPIAIQNEYGDTPFGRGCLAARRLTEAGVRCVEVTLGGWDTHANNQELCLRRAKELDPAFAALVRDLKRRGTLEQTLIFCVGEFGRTPTINALGGRDHWPHGFTAVLAGGGIRGGTVIGETDLSGGKSPRDPVPVANLHATVLAALGIDWQKNLHASTGRTVRRSAGEPLRALLG